MRSVVEIGASVPAFLGKLWKLVNDSETNNLISWSPGGKTFVIKNQAEFARELLPLYYKHNNMASFIRQLNMYGFHKITSVENGGLRYEKDEIEFSHPCFMRGHAYLLEHIKRKIANPKSIVASNESGEKILLKPELMNKVLADVKQMKGKQESLDAKFSAMKQENEALWREVAILRQKHIKQQQIVNNLIQFLMSLVQPTRAPNANGNNVGVKRPFQLMINNAAHVSTSDGPYSSRAKNIKLDKEVPLEDINEDNLEDGPTIHELAHDDVLHNDASQDSLDPTNFVTVDITSNPEMFVGHNSGDPSSAIQYHVTMADGDEGETDWKLTYPANRKKSVRPTKVVTNAGPVVTSPSPMMPSPSPITPSPTSPIPQNTLEQPINIVTMTSPGTSKPKEKGHKNKDIISSGKHLLSPSNYNTINNSADFKLPAEIFASDDSVSDAGVTSTDDFTIRNIVQDAVQTEPTVSMSKDEMLGGVNIKVEKSLQNSKPSKKTKKAKNNEATDLNLADIKTELQDYFDWNNMTLATVNNNTNVNRFQSVNDIDDHLDTMQTDLDSLRELLRSDSYSLDTNTLLGNADAGVEPAMSLVIPFHQHTMNDYLFGSEDPFYGLSFNPSEERAKANNNAKKKGDISNVSGEENRAQSQCSEDDAEGYQLISYTGNIPYLEDINLPELEGDSSQEAPLSVAPSPSSSTLNTPRVDIEHTPRP
ncbi:PREDICTED: heat shock factor protein isoform X2 [Papilio xuthus]|uniref:Heat shock factor protein isoform X2 n=1 Tax=Papilio xuthus TaxID=66420 RepID=A0AAJ7EGQ2_PAPXU|nr:PREDICTED: heat shock factor protein isoform X2 [Papilio xuthus]